MNRAASTDLSSNLERGDRRSPWGELKSILVAIDGSRSSMDARDFAVELAAEQQAQLLFVHVIPTIDTWATWDEDGGYALPHEPTEQDRAVLDIAAELAASQGVHVTTALLGGPTTAEIVAYGESHGVDLIILGSRGHGAVAGALFGSVSRAVSRKTTLPVVIVRGDGRSTHTATGAAPPSTTPLRSA
ncbi:MAG: universal stress protein [Acidimicrobiales bacterium]